MATGLATAVPTALDRAGKYLDTIGGAVSGQGGHKTTFWAARVLVRGFLLPDAEAYRMLAERFNPRCKPEWSEKELRHKIEDAAALALWFGLATPRGRRGLRFGFRIAPSALGPRAIATVGVAT